MTHKSTLTALLAFICMLCLNVQSQSVRDMFGSKHITERQREIDSLKMRLSEPFSNYDLPKKKNPGRAKSASSYALRLDSVLETGGFRTTFSYDGNGNCILEAEYSWEVPNGWVNYSSIETVYNPENLVVEWILYNSNNPAMILQPYRKETYAYDANGMVSVKIIYNWLEDEWKPFAKSSWTYDEQENLIETTGFLWNADIQQFEYTGKSDLFYNAENGLIETIGSVWNTNQWVVSSKQVYTLNSENQPVLRIFYSWEPSINDWKAMGSVEYVYNEAGLELESIWSSWVFSAFVPYSKFEQQYDLLNRRISEKGLTWNETENDWLALYMETFEFDDLNNMVETISYGWNAELGDFIPYSKYAFTYDSDYPISGIMGPADYVDYFLHMLLSVTLSYFDQEWMELAIVDLYHTPLDAMSTANRADVPIQIYPNPFRETVRFSGTEEVMHLTLYNLQGQRVLQKQLSGQGEVNLRNLPSGMYIYTLLGINSRHTGKLVRE